MAYLCRSVVGSQDTPLLRFKHGDLSRELIAYWGVYETRAFTRDDVPEEAILETKHKILREHFRMGGQRLFSTEAKELIELFEPNIHQFFRVDVSRGRSKLPIFRRDGSLLDTPYYLLNAMRRLDAVIPEKSNVRVRHYDNQPTSINWTGYSLDAVLDKKLIGGHHLWTGAHHLYGDLFFSDELGEAYLAKGWKGLELTRLAED